MADLVITAANVVKGTDAQIKHGFAGVTITAGQSVYLDSADNTYKLADCNSATAAARIAAGIALNGASAGQPLAVQYGGKITIGAVTAAGTVYCLSGTAGGVRPVADNATGDRVMLLGVGISTTQIQLSLFDSGAVVP